MGRSIGKTGVFSKKNFLNRPFHHSDASIHSSITIYHESKGGYIDASASLKIADCSRSISLEVELGGTTSEYNNTLYKIDTLIDHLSALREGCAKGRKIYLEKKAENDAYRKEQKKKAKKSAGTKPLLVREN